MKDNSLDRKLNGKKTKGVKKYKEKSKLNNMAVGSGIGIDEFIDILETVFELVIGLLKVIFVPDFDD